MTPLMHHLAKHVAEKIRRHKALKASRFPLLDAVKSEITTTFGTIAANELDALKPELVAFQNAVFVKLKEGPR